MRSIAGLFALLATLSLRAEPRLIEPRDGAELAGGSLVTIEWSGDVAPDVNEWEAFLSVDGGRWFSTRITPHLDADIHRFTFEVPNVASLDARILLRFGDEQRETEVGVPSRFTIRFDPAAVRVPIAISTHDGEPARRGERGVSRWVTGARNGSQLRTIVRRDRSCSSAPSLASVSTHDENAESASSELATPARIVARGTIVEEDIAHPRAAPRVSDLLLAMRRLNI